MEALSELIGLNTQQQRTWDSDEQPQEGIDMLDTKIYIFITIYREAENDEIEDRANQYWQNCKFLPWDITLEPCVAANEPENQQGNSPEECQCHKLQATEEHQQTVFRLTRHILKKCHIIPFRRIILFYALFQFLNTILSFQIHLCLIPIVPRISQDVKERSLSFHKDIPLKVTIALLSIVVCFLQSQIRLLIMRTIIYHGSTVFCMHFQEFGSIADAGVTESDSCLVKHKWRRQCVLDCNPYDLFLQRGNRVRHVQIKRVIAIKQTIWQYLRFYLLYHRR